MHKCPCSSSLGIEPGILGQSGSTFPYRPEETQGTLILCETQVWQQQMLLDELCVKEGMKPKNKKNRSKDHQEARMKDPAYQIPKKTFKMSQLSSLKGDGKPKWGQKLCQLCAQWSPIANTLMILVNVVSGTRM